MWIAIVRSLSFLFLDDFEGNTNISVAIEFNSTVRVLCRDFSRTVLEFLTTLNLLFTESSFRAFSDSRFRLDFTVGAQHYAGTY